MGETVENPGQRWELELRRCGADLRSLAFRGCAQPTLVIHRDATRCTETVSSGGRPDPDIVLAILEEQGAPLYIPPHNNR